MARHLLSDAEREQVREAIEAAERRTDAELVTVLARRSDPYLFESTLFAAAAAFLVPLLLELLPHWIEPHVLLEAQWLTLAALALALRWTPLLRRVLPRALQRRRAAALARQQFLANGLHRTKGRTGVLLFVSEQEHYVELLADEGIARVVEPAQWEEIVARFILAVRAGQTLDGFLAATRECADLLEQHVPFTGEKDELPNHLRVLD